MYNASRLERRRMTGRRPYPSGMTRGTWREQYDRTRRWYGRFADTNAGKTHDRESESYRDDVHAFFLNCYHLKDWLGSDPASGVSSQDAEGCVNASLDLMLCRDLANAVKHMKLTTSRASKDTALGRTHYALGLNVVMGPAEVEPTRISATYEVSSDGNTYDAFEIATRALAAWDAFLTSRGLLPSP